MTRKSIKTAIIAALIICLSIQAYAIGEMQNGPVIWVTAPPDAKSVTAYFSFGLIRKLRLDEVRGRWSARVLASRQISEDVYNVNIRIVHADESVGFETLQYVVDSSRPEFEVHAPQTTYGGEMLPIEVDPFEPAQAVYAYILGAPKKRFHFSPDPNRGTYKAMIQMPERFEDEKIIIRIVVRDREGHYLLRSIDVYDLDLLEEYGDLSGRW